MSLAVVRTATLLGVEGRTVSVEVHVGGGLPGFTLVGLPDTAVREARERVRAALLSCELPWPTRRVVVNLAPSAVRKTGAGLDLALGLGILLATDELPAGCLDGVGVLGELGLDGSVRSVPGTLALAVALRDAGVQRLIVPFANAAEAALVSGLDVLPAVSVGQARFALKGELAWPEPPTVGDLADDLPGGLAGGPDPLPDELLDLTDVRGLATARTALAACAAGDHHLLLVGPPGVGKTMLAQRLPSILPPLERDTALDVTRIHSAAGEPLPRHGLVTRRPFRAPHHTASTTALVGGGSPHPRPGEVTKAHAGVLFLDELGEFTPSALDALRQPLEEGVVRIARQATSVAFPARFTLVASSNPCPCGLGPPLCTCDEARRARYRRRMSAPLLDRFDLRVLVTAPERSEGRGESSADARARVGEAVERQEHRFRRRPWSRNGSVPAGALVADLSLEGEAYEALADLADGGALTGRGLAGVRRVARTLADLDGAPAVSPHHVVLAGELRQEVVE